jgi:hypothetical protein
MRRWLAIAAVFVALFALPAWGQRHGGGAGFAGHPPSGFRGSMLGGHGPGFGGGIGFGTGFRPGAGFRRPFFSPNRFSHARFFYGYPSVYPYVGAYYAYPGYYSNYYPDYTYPSAQATLQGYDTSAAYSDSTNQIQQDQIDRLENEVDRLREERDSRSQPPAKPEPQSATQLVFQDKHSEEVQNYAIVGRTLWIFTELRARKVPLSDLDLAATTQANEERGVDFRLPE